MGSPAAAGVFRRRISVYFVTFLSQSQTSDRGRPAIGREMRRKAGSHVASSRRSVVYARKMSVLAT